MKSVYENVMVKRELGDAEKVEGSKLLAQLIIKLTEVEADKAAMSADFGQQIKAAKKEICDLAKVLKDGFEMIEVRAERFEDWGPGEIYYVDQESGDEVHRRKMTAEEKQMRVPGME